MDDEIIGRIGELVDEEHHLHSKAVEKEGLSEEDQRRLEELEVRLDQCWDLLRQRRALRTAGADPAAAHVRDADTVEHYRQ
jgi:hypothetical protein